MYGNTYALKKKNTVCLTKQLNAFLLMLFPVLCCISNFIFFFLMGLIAEEIIRCFFRNDYISVLQFNVIPPLLYKCIAI